LKHSFPTRRSSDLVEDSAAAGVRLHTTGVWASTGITVIEGDYENPPEDPRHCPAAHTEIRIQPRGATRRILLYYQPHRPSPARWCTTTTVSLCDLF
jgi:hypothetical protein